MRHIHRYRSLAWLVLFVFMFTLVPVLPGQAADEIKITDIKNAYGFRDVTRGTTVIIEGTGFGDTGHVIFRVGEQSLSVKAEDILAWSPNEVIVAAPNLPTGLTPPQEVEAVIVKTADRSASYTAKQLRYINNPEIDNVYPIKKSRISGFKSDGSPIVESDSKQVAFEGKNLEKAMRITVSTAGGNSVLYSILERDKEEPNYAGVIEWDKDKDGVYIGGPYIRWNNKIMDGNDLTIKVENTARGESEEYTKVQGDQQLSKIGIPEASSFNPSPAALVRGMKLEIIGSNFKELNIEHNEVFIAGGKAEVQSGSAHKLVVTVPGAADLNQHTLRIKVKRPEPDGRVEAEAVYTGAINIIPTPGDIELLDVLPNFGKPGGGDKVTLIGKGFDTNTEVAFQAPDQKWEGLGQELQLLSADEVPAGYEEGAVALSITTPQAPGRGTYTGPVNVTVRDKNLPAIVKDTRIDGFFYTHRGQELRLTGIAPKIGSEKGGTKVILTGENFFKFRQEGSKRYVNEDELPGDANENEIKVSPPSTGVVLKEKLSEYKGYKNVEIERTVSFSLGGIPIAITGLETGQDGIQYLRGTTRAHPLEPLELERTVDVEVTVNEAMYLVKDGGLERERLVIKDDPPVVERAILSQAFSYVRLSSTPDITSITPNYGPTAGDTEVIVEGFNFYNGVEVYFGTVRARVDEVIPGPIEGGRQKATIKLHTPACGVRGKVDVRVQNWDKGEAVAEDGFEYVSSPQVTAVNPGLAPETGGLYLAIDGQEFMYGLAVKIGSQVVVGKVYEDESKSEEYYRALLKELFPEETITFHSGGKIRVTRDGVELQDYDTDLGNQIILKVPSGEAGEHELTVINPDRGWASWDKKFVYKEFKEDLKPVVKSIHPNEGNIGGGETIIITGTNFREGCLVTIDGRLATGVSVGRAGQEISCVTPPGTRAEVWVPLQVINVDPTGIGMVTVDEGFRYHTVFTRPVIEKFVPTHGGEGTKVYVQGNDFVVGSDTRVFLGSRQLHTVSTPATVAGQVYVKSPTEIQFIVPDLGEPGPYELRVVNPDTAEAAARDKFVFQIPRSAPNITRVEPQKGSSLGGTDILVEGSDFHKDLELYIGREQAAILGVQLLEFDAEKGVWGECLIRAKTPPLPAGESPGAVDVMVLNPDGGTARRAGAFTYIVPGSTPKIRAVEPAQGPAEGNEVVTLHGLDFRDQNKAGEKVWPVVTFGGVAGEVIKDDTIAISQGAQLKVRTPAYPGGGAVDVTITNPDSGTYTLTGGYTFVTSRPLISTVIPSKFSRHHASLGMIYGSQFVPPVKENGKKAGTDVLLGDAFGTSFTSLRDLTDDGYTTIDGVEYENIEVKSDGTIRVVISPADRVGSRILRVKNPDGGQADYTIEYVSPVVKPGRFIIEPNQGSSKGGTNVTITGSNFREPVEVYFGDKLAELIKFSETELVLRTPAYSLPEMATSARVDVTVFNTVDGGSIVKPDGFTYVKGEGEPVITSIDPNRGTSEGGTKVTIQGENFREGCEVFFGQKKAEMLSYKYDALLVISPPHPPGAVDVAVRNPAPDYSEAIAPNGFTYERTIAPVPGEFDGKIWNKRAIKLFWTPSEVPSTYEIYVSTSSYEDSREYLGSTRDTEYMFEDIDADCRYHFWLRTINEHGTSGFIPCQANPIYVSEDDITNRPPTARIDDVSPQITLVGDELKIIVGRDLTFWRFPYYEIMLDAVQRGCTSLEMLIPGEGIEKNPDTTIRLSTNTFEVSIPVRALTTFEYESFARLTRDPYVRLRLTPAPGGYLESMVLNRPGSRLAGGFMVETDFYSETRQAELTFLASDINVTWTAERAVPLGRLQAVYYDDTNLRWVDATRYADSGSGRVNVKVGQPNIYAIFN